MLAATLAIATGREDDGARWMLRGSVVGGVFGFVVLVWRWLF
jgi:hypothetical protein